MGLQYVDNFHFWSTPGLGTFTSVSNLAVTSNILTIQSNQGFAFLSSGITAGSTFIVNVRVNLSGIPSQPSRIFTLEDNGASQCGLYATGSANLQFNRGLYFQSGTNIGPSSPFAMTLDVGLSYYDIESKVTIGSSGSIECRVAGGVQIPTTTANTQLWSGTANSFRFGATASGGTGGVYRFQHIIVMDTSGTRMNDFIGPVDVILLPPTGDGFYTDWNFTGAASAWEAVSELNPDDDTSYIYDGVVGDKETFTHDPLPGTYTAVVGTAVWTRARRDDATTRAFKTLMRDPSGPTDALGGTKFYTNTGYNWFMQAFESSPFTGGSTAWTLTEVNNVEYGAEIVTP